MPVALPILIAAVLAQGQSGDAQRTDSVLVDQRTILETTISTERILPQISHRFVFQPKLPENPMGKLSENPVGPNDLPVGGLLGHDPGTTLAKIPGITATGWRPPDPHLAVGPTALVEVVNSSIAFFNRAGGKTFETELGSFFTSVNPGSFVFDPKVFYDWHAGRFVLCALDVDDGSQESHVLFAVSDDSDPAGDWHAYRIDSEMLAGGVQNWGDYPGFGYNRDGYVIALNLFGFSPSTFNGVELIAIRKSSVVNGGSAVVTRFLNTGADSYSVQSSENLNGASNKVFLANAVDDSTLKIWTVSNLDTTPPTPTTQLLTVPTYGTPNSGGAPSPGGRFLDELDGRLINVMYTGGRLVTTHTVKGVTDDRRRVRWYEIAIAPTGGAASLIQSGEVKEPGAALKHYFIGAIAKAPTGDIALIMTKSGETGPVADIVRTIRRGTDPVGTMGAPVLLKSAGGATYGISGFNRWGDYASVAVDPQNQRALWGVHMTGDAGTEWETHFYSFAASATVTPSIANMTLSPSTTIGGGTAVTGTITTSASSPANQTVYLSSSNTFLATVAPTTTIAAGTTTKTFPVVLQNGVNATTVVKITAKLNGVAFARVLTLNPATLADFTLSSSSIAAGNSVTGTVILNGKAGPSGRTVLLSSTNPVAVVPAGVTLASGTKTKSFTIFTQNTTVQKVATISATLGATINRTLTVVVPPPLIDFTITPASVTGGATAVGKPTLGAPAPVGGVLVKFIENSPNVTVPASVVIGAGNTTINVSVATTAVVAPTIVTVEARLNGTVRTDTITINP